MSLSSRVSSADAAAWRKGFLLFIPSLPPLPSLRPSVEGVCVCSSGPTVLSAPRSVNVGQWSPKLFWIKGLLITASFIFTCIDFSISSSISQQPSVFTRHPVLVKEAGHFTSVHRSNTFVQTQISHQLLDGFPLHLIQVYMFPRGVLFITLAILHLLINTTINTVGVFP